MVRLLQFLVKRNKINMKKIIVIVLTFIIVSVVLCSLTNYSLVIPISASDDKNKELNKGDTVNPLSEFDLNKGNWSAYIVISRSDFKDLNLLITKARCLKTTNIEVLKKMKKEWNFIYKGEDVATVESSIYIFRNSKLVFHSAIVLDKNRQGLQNMTYGWIEPINHDALIGSCKQFKRVYSPIVFL